MIVGTIVNYISSVPLETVSCRYQLGNENGTVSKKTRKTEQNESAKVIRFARKTKTSCSKICPEHEVPSCNRLHQKQSIMLLELARKQKISSYKNEVKVKHLSKNCIMLQTFARKRKPGMKYEMSRLLDLKLSESL